MKRMASPLPPPSSILVVCIRLIGDVILSTPLVGVLKDTWPAAAVDLLVNRGTGEFLEKDPRVRRVIYASGGESTKRPGQREAGYIGRIFRKYDMAICMGASDRGILAAAVAGRRLRIGFLSGAGGARDYWKKRFLTHSLPYPYTLHVARICQVTMEMLGIDVKRLEAKVYWDEEDEQVVRRFLRDQGIDGSYFVIHPFARWRYKYWRPDRFAKVNDAVYERHGLSPVWTSSPDPEETGLLRRTAEGCRHAPALAPGIFTLNQMACLLSRASMYVGLDTAVSHLAATVSAPMVVLYGPTVAERWSPWNNDGPVEQQCPRPRGTQRTGRTILLQTDMPCVPCGKAGCDDLGGESPCLQAIEVGEVLAAVAELLEHPPPERPS